MATRAILVSLAIVGTVMYLLLRSRQRRNRLLSIAARREKHAPKEIIPPRAIQNKSRTNAKKTDERDGNKTPSQTRAPKQLETPTASSELVDSSRQVNQLNRKEREQYDTRNQERDENLRQLSLLVEDLLDETSNEGETSTDVHSDEAQIEDAFSNASIDVRTTWIEQNEEPLNQHASLVETEEIGSGIQVLDAESTANDDIEERLEREGGKTGEVQISLAWDDFNDLDLHIFCPSGERIYFNNKTSECGGELDVDMNVRPTSNNAVENVVWIENAPLGQYKVGVHFYKHHSKEGTTQTCEFRARITTHGIARDYSGAITHGQAMQMVTSFTLGETVS